MCISMCSVFSVELYCCAVVRRAPSSVPASPIVFSLTFFPTYQPPPPPPHTTNASYEFTTPAGLHVALSAAAQRGQIYVCGVTASTSAAWEAEKGAAARIVKSFRLRDGTSA